MKKFKSIMFSALALAPLLAVIVFALGNVGATNGVDYIPLGSVSVEIAENGAIFSFETDSWASCILEPVIGSEPLTGVYGAFGRLLLHIEEFAGIPISFPVVFIVFYAIYLFMAELLFACIDLILFIPRKVSEVFRCS